MANIIPFWLKRKKKNQVPVTAKCVTVGIGKRKITFRIEELDKTSTKYKVGGIYKRDKRMMFQDIEIPPGTNDRFQLQIEGQNSTICKITKVYRKR